MIRGNARGIGSRKVHLASRIRKVNQHVEQLVCCWCVVFPEFSLIILARPISGTEKHRKRVATKTVVSVARTSVVKGWRSQDYARIICNNLQQLDNDYEVQGKACISGIWYVDGTSRITKKPTQKICEPRKHMKKSMNLRYFWRERSRTLNRTNHTSPSLARASEVSESAFRWRWASTRYSPAT